MALYTSPSRSDLASWFVACSSSPQNLDGQNALPHYCWSCCSLNFSSSVASVICACFQNTPSAPPQNVPQSHLKNCSERTHDSVVAFCVSFYSISLASCPDWPNRRELYLSDQGSCRRSCFGQELYHLYCLLVSKRDANPGLSCVAAWDLVFEGSSFNMYFWNVLELEALFQYHQFFRHKSP